MEFLRRAHRHLVLSAVAVVARIVSTIGMYIPENTLPLLTLLTVSQSVQIFVMLLILRLHSM
jgi:hypothetical protein